MCLIFLKEEVLVEEEERNWKLKGRDVDGGRKTGADEVIERRMFIIVRSER